MTSLVEIILCESFAFIDIQFLILYFSTTWKYSYYNCCDFFLVDNQISSIPSEIGLLTNLEKIDLSELLAYVHMIWLLDAVENIAWSEENCLYVFICHEIFLF
jgi:hypothetical protein